MCFIVDCLRFAVTPIGVWKRGLFFPITTTLSLIRPTMKTTPPASAEYLAACTKKPRSGSTNWTEHPDDRYGTTFVTRASATRKVIWRDCATCIKTRCTMGSCPSPINIRGAAPRGSNARRRPRKSKRSTISRLTACRSMTNTHRSGNYGVNRTMECGGKRSATPLLISFGSAHTVESGVAQACRRTPYQPARAAPRDARRISPLPHDAAIAFTF